MRVINRLARRVGLQVTRVDGRKVRLQLPSPSHDPLARYSSGLRVALSVYGFSARYLEGALECVRMYGEMFPGWDVSIHGADNLPARYLDELSSFPNVRVVLHPGEGHGAEATAWRFTEALDPNARVVIFRDADSRPSLRERAAVDEWLVSDKLFHVMRDHPAHGFPILAGLFGARGKGLAVMATKLQDYDFSTAWFSDQEFLASSVYPTAAESLLVHQDYAYFKDVDSGSCVRPFSTAPSHSVPFLGLGFEADGTHRVDHSNLSEDLD